MIKATRKPRSSQATLSFVLLLGILLSPLAPLPVTTMAQPLVASDPVPGGSGGASSLQEGPLALSIVEPGAQTASLPRAAPLFDATWAVETVDGTGDRGQYSSLQIDATGHLHISYYDPLNTALRYAHRDGSSWATEAVDSAGDVGQYSSLALDANGHPHISYYDYTGDIGKPKYARYTGSAWVSETLAYSDDAGRYASLSLDTNGHPHISYIDTGAGYLLIYAYNDGSWHYTTVDGSGHADGSTSLALQDGLHPRIAYRNYYSNSLQYAFQSAGWAISDVTGPNNGGGSASLALDTGGSPHIAYTKGSDFQELMYAYHDGSAWVVEPVDDTGDVGSFTSLALDASGRAHVAYYDDSNGVVRYAVRDGGTWSIQAVASGLSADAHPSLALDGTGYPHISYHHAGQGLRHAWLQPCAAPQIVDVNAPETFVSGTAVWLTATVSPPTATLPITFAWQLPGQSPLARVVSSTESTVFLSATVTGTHVMTVTAQNCGGIATSTREVQVEEPALPDLMVTDLWSEGTEIGYQIMNGGSITAPAGYVLRTTVDGLTVSSETIRQSLGPGKRLNGKLRYAWICSRSEDTVRATVDAGGAVEEKDEANNARQETWPCDAQPPVITRGPSVDNITANSAIVHWTTDELCDSAVQYGMAAGQYDDQKVDARNTQNHQISLTGLSPATVYHYQANSTDANGLQAFSGELFFETAAASSSAPPSGTVEVSAAMENYDAYVFQANYRDYANVERVEFYLDDEHVGTDYEGDANGTYQLTFDPHARGWVAGTFFDLRHTVEARAWSWARVGQVNPYLFEPQRDTIPVDLAITFPPPGFTVYIDQDTVPAGKRVDIFVEAAQYEWKCTWNGSSIPAAGVAPDCGDVAKAVEYVQFLVDNQVKFTSYPSNDTDLNHGWTLELGGLSPLPRTVKVRAFDSDYVSHEVQTTIDIHQVVNEPALNVTRDIVREGSHFRVGLTVENDPAASGYARVTAIKDYATAFYAVPKTAAEYVVNTSYGYWNGTGHGLTTVQIDVASGANDYVELDPGESLTVEYLLVPILYDPAVDFAIGGMGHDVRVYYQTPEGESEMRGFDRRVVPLQSMANNALAAADYLLVTHPKNLAGHYGGSGLRTVLSEMAHLASLKQGVLAFLEGDDPRDALDASIAPGGGWASRLHPDFETTGKGYMLIVGEVEIVPSFYRDGFDLNWADGDVDYVNYTDHPYADTGGGGAPDLIVGRIVGDNAAGLAQAMRTSANVHLGTAGYGYDRSHAALFSGTGNSMGSFQANVDSMTTDLMGEGISVAKSHWEYSGLLRSYSFDFEKHDVFATGDTDGDGDDELLVADRDDHVYILDEYGNVVGGFDRSFMEGEAMAVGDLDGNGVDEIVIGDRDDYIAFYTPSGTQLYYFPHDFEKYDDLAIGNLTGDAKEEIVMGDRHDQIYVMDLYGTVLHQFSLNYQAHDGLALGDVNGDGLDEIVVADLSADTIWAYDILGTQVISLAHQFLEGDTLAVGDLFGDAKEEILIGTDSAINVYMSNGTFFEPQAARSIYATWNSFDGLAVRRRAGADEIWHASRQDYLNLMDSGYAANTAQVLRTMVLGKDLIYFSGHGNTNVWGPWFSTGYFPVDFGDTNPFVLAPTCLSGNYQAGNDYGMAEAFLEHGAGVYIGSTEVSPIDINCSAGLRFLDSWDASETIGKSFLDLERNRWNKGDLDWWSFWVTEYNLYGDPKFGDPSAISLAAASTAMSVPQAPPPTLALTLPDYVVTPREDGYVDVDLPGGDLIQEQGAYRIPYWSVSIDYPQGQRVQDVTLTDRSELTTATGLPITTTGMYIACAAPGCSQSTQPKADAQISLQGDAWTPAPERVYQWSVLDNPDGTSTLVIQVYPFSYQPLTQNVRFYKRFSFDIESITSTVSIERLSIDKPAYAPGDEVAASIWLSSTSTPQDVIVEATIRDGSSGEVVDGLPMRSLHDLSGSASYAMTWDSTGFDVGDYALEVALRDTSGALLDRATQVLRLGITSGEVTAFSATPGLFKVGEVIDISMAFSNTGSTPISGTAVIQVQSADGVTVTNTFTHAIANLAPGSEIALDDAWDTVGAAGEAYRIVGYVLYNSVSTAPEIVDVSTRMRVYLPLVPRDGP